MDEIKVSVTITFSSDIPQSKSVVDIFLVMPFPPVI